MRMNGFESPAPMHTRSQEIPVHHCANTRCFIDLRYCFLPWRALMRRIHSHSNVVALAILAADTEDRIKR